jgi:phosphoglycerate kinase
MKTIDDLDVKGKKVIIRVDINSPVEKESGNIVLNPRILSHSKTIRELSQKGAKVIIIAHQGRKGDEDFLNLRGHAQVLSQVVKHPITFIDEIVGPRAKAAIQTMKDGDVLLLENVRFLEDETAENVEEAAIVKEIAPLADYFFLDALSVAHRGHASVVGFTKKIPSAAGRILKEEIDALDQIMDSTDVTFVFGGSKPEDSMGIMKKWLDKGKIKNALIGGVMGILFLKVSGHPIGKSEEFLKSKVKPEYVEEAKNLLVRYKDRIVVPIDVGLNVEGKRIDCDANDSATIAKGEIFDIGPKTAAKYRDILSAAKTIMINGPMGVYEIDDFSAGTKAVLNIIADCQNFSIAGGGHTITAIEKFHIEKSKFSYISLSGKALIEYLSGKELVGISALKESAKKHF